jgi:hypothetical protein
MKRVTLVCSKWLAVNTKQEVRLYDDKMVSESQVMRRKYSAATTNRKRRQRARELWRRLQYEGWESLEELQHDVTELNVPETWQGIIGGRCRLQNGMENVTADDLPPSGRVLKTLLHLLASARPFVS